MLGDGSDTPGDDRLGDFARLDRFDYLVLFGSSDLTQEDHIFHIRVALHAEHIVDKDRTDEAVATDRHPLGDTVGVEGDDVTKLVKQTAGAGHQTGTSGTVKLGLDDVLDGSADIGNLEGTGSDGPDGRGSDDGNAGISGRLVHRPCQPLGDPFGGDHDHPELIGDGNRFHGHVIGRPEGGEVQQNIRVGMGLHRLLGAAEDIDHDLVGTPEELLELGTAGRRHDRGDGRRLPIDHIVIVQHPLDRTLVVVPENRLGIPCKKSAHNIPLLPYFFSSSSAMRTMSVTWVSGP